MNRSSHDKDADDNVGTTNKRKRAPSRKPDHERMAKRSSSDSRSAPETTTTTTGESTSSWTEQIHRQFVQAIMELGMEQASPSTIIDNMNLQHAALSSERVKSHLQKYRRNGKKSKSEFTQEYDYWMQTALTMGATTTASPLMIAEMLGSDNHPRLLGGHSAAFLSFAALAEEHTITDAQPMMMQFPPDIPRQDFVGANVHYPALTPQERRTPLGASIMRAVALCSSMTQYVLEEREAAKRGATTGLQSSSLEGEYAGAALPQALSTDPSMDSSVLECILPLDRHSTKPHHQYERKMPEANTEDFDS
jgi:SHAQKYF class myb-like DNA-binding protein